MGLKQLVVLETAASWDGAIASGAVGANGSGCVGCNFPMLRWFTRSVSEDGLERVNARWQREWACRGELRRKVPDGVLLSVGLNDTARVGR